MPAKVLSIGSELAEADKKLNQLHAKYEDVCRSNDEQHAELSSLNSLITSLKSAMKEKTEEVQKLQVMVTEIRDVRKQLVESEAAKKLELDRVRKETRRATLKLVRLSGTTDYDKPIAISAEEDSDGSAGDPERVTAVSDVQRPLVSRKKTVVLSEASPGISIRVATGGQSGELAEELQALREENSVLREAEAARTALLREKAEELLELQKQLAGDARENEDLQTIVDRLQNEISSKNEEISRLLAEVARCEERAASVERECAELEARLQESAHVSEQFATVTALIKRNCEEVDALRAKIATLENEIQCKGLELARLKMEKDLAENALEHAKPSPSRVKIEPRNMTTPPDAQPQAVVVHKTEEEREMMARKTLSEADAGNRPAKVENQLSTQRQHAALSFARKSIRQLIARNFVLESQIRRDNTRCSVVCRRLASSRPCGRGEIHQINRLCQCGSVVWVPHLSGTNSQDSSFHYPQEWMKVLRR